MEAMNYKDLIKKVHPDLNPGIADAGVKVSQIMANKNNPSELMRLAIQWGLIEGEKPKPQKPIFDPFEWVIFSHFNHKHFKPGMKVWFTSDKGDTIAWFVKSGRGRVFFTDKKGVFTINKSLKELYNKFQIFRFRRDDMNPFEINEWSDIIKNLGKKQPKKSTAKTKTNNHDDFFSKLDLEPNREYYGDRYVGYKNSYYKLWKTNDKCAFIIIDGEMKKVQLKSLRKGWNRI